MDFIDEFSKGSSRAWGNEDLLLLRDAFSTVLYRPAALNAMADAPPADVSGAQIPTFADNAAFWRAVLAGTVQRGSQVAIRGAHLTEWIPAAPGRYFTHYAEDIRREAEFRYHANDLEGQLYSPPGKLSMIEGGIGTFRLPAESGSEPVYYLGLSTNGIAHQGIPVILYETHIKQLFDRIKKAGGCVINAVGRVESMPSSLTTRVLSYSRGNESKVPRLCFIPQTIEYLRESHPGDLRTTVYVMFVRGLDERLQERPAWTYCTFSPCPEDRKGLDHAVDWLKHFADRYSRLQEPRILTDFDADHEHFGHTVEFPLSDIWASRVNTEKLETYGRPFGKIGHKMLTPVQCRTLQEALISAFPNIGSLRQMVQYRLDANLNALAVGGSLAEITHKLILWADIADRIPDLLKAARTVNEGNDLLQAVATQLSVLYQD